MKVLLAPFGSRGDVHPMIALGVRMAAEGHDVTVAGPPDYVEDAERRGLRYRSYGYSIDEFLHEQAADYAGGALRSHRALNCAIERSLQAEFDELPEIASGSELIVGAGVQLGGPSVAERLGVPYRYVFYCPALVRSPASTPVLFPVRSLPRWANALAWRLVISGYTRTMGGQLNRGRAGLGLPPVKDMYMHVLGQRPVLACDEALWKVPPDAEPSPVQVGYLAPRDERALPPDVVAYLDAGEPPVYVGFGSNGEIDADATTRTLVDGVRRAGRRALVARGTGRLGSAIADRDVFVVDDCDHAKLFPRVAAVVHHGGAGTTATAARAGIPQIIVSHLNEQHAWGTRTRELGVGVPPIPRAKLSVARLQRAVEAAVGDPAMQRRAAALAAGLRDQDPAAQAMRALGLSDASARNASSATGATR